jgi:hypothetical protein
VEYIAPNGGILTTIAEYIGGNVPGWDRYLGDNVRVISGRLVPPLNLATPF